MAEKNDRVVTEIRQAWQDPTDWEQFGRDVGDILIAERLTTKPESDDIG